MAENTFYMATINVLFLLSFYEVASYAIVHWV